jgi:hypothetical protein
MCFGKRNAGASDDGYCKQGLKCIMPGFSIREKKISGIYTLSVTAFEHLKGQSPEKSRIFDKFAFTL